MNHSEPNTTNLVLGSCILGIWFFLAIAMGDGSDTWMGGGVIALLVGGAMVGLRYATDQAKTILSILVGLAIGFLFIGLVAMASIEALFSAMLAVLGAVVVALGLPRPVMERAWQQTGDSPSSSE